MSQITAIWFGVTACNGGGVLSNDRAPLQQWLFSLFLAISESRKDANPSAWTTSSASRVHVQNRLLFCTTIILRSPSCGNLKINGYVIEIFLMSRSRDTEFIMGSIRSLNRASNPLHIRLREVAIHVFLLGQKEWWYASSQRRCRTRSIATREHPWIDPLGWL